MTRIARLMRIGLVLCAAAAGLPAQAVDIATVRPVQPLPEAQVQVAGRAVKLPPGSWTYVSHVRGRYATDSNNSMVYHVGYFASTAGTVFHGGVVVELGESRMPTRSWADDPCKREASVHKALLEPSPMFVECVLIDRRPSLHRGATSAFFKPVSEWLVQQGVDQSQAVYDVLYLHYKATGQGALRVFVPVGRVASEKALVEWALGLPERMRPLVQGSEREIALPPLPGTP